MLIWRSSIQQFSVVSSNIGYISKGGFTPSGATQQKCSVASRHLVWIHLNVHRSRQTLWCSVVYLYSFVSSLLWFSLALNTGNLQGDIFINTVVSAALEVPSVILTIFLLEVKFLGRRINCCASLLLTGLTCLCCIPMILFGRNFVVISIYYTSLLRAFLALDICIFNIQRPSSLKRSGSRMSVNFTIQ